MSVDGLDRADIIELLKDDQNGTSCTFAGCSLIIYENILTMSREVELIRRRGWTSATILLVVNRFVTIGFATCSIFEVFKWTTAARFDGFQHASSRGSLTSLSRCEVVEIFSSVFQLMYFVIWAAFSSLRVYAVTHRSWKPALLTLLLGLVPFATNIVGIIAQTQKPGETPTCSIASDFVVLITTLMNTYTIKRDADRANIKAPIATLLFRDGTLYFLCFLLLNIMHVILYATNTFTTALVLLLPLMSIVISRFLLNLHDAHQSLSRNTTTDTMQLSFVDPSSLPEFLVSMGAPLQHSWPFDAPPHMLSGDSVAVELHAKDGRDGHEGVRQWDVEEGSIGPGISEAVSCSAGSSTAVEDIVEELRA
ncbi:hypothetical protein CERSUDRAFT_98613 [Gelatoporia subvermispora B]|uniref:DUF6533 domain-containing protein n=1 Tax=Ceriporiopsis subvermispora (strain B) TaxID=914234 RepID=M2QMX4_CERS8|nr:hypothetical protein CERSUDRAFT_98613 [Gelatoporia subvermispora B]